jgi:peptide/nickel transport system substrate-binding protein
MRWSDLPGWWPPAWLLVALALICSPTAWATADELVIGQRADVSHLDPHYSTLASDINVYVNLYDTLVGRDEHLALVPALATSWARLDDTTWHFRLRQGVVFHNGDPLTAEDVRFSLERAAADNPRTSVYATLHLIERVEIVDSYAVRIITQQPDPLLPARLASPGGMILPKRYFERVGMEGFRQAPIGTGAVEFVDWKQGESLVLAANPRYWRGPIPYAKVIYKPYPETAGRLAALLAGTADFITDVPPDQVGVIEGSATAKVEGALAAGFIGLFINVSKPPLDRKSMRQAMHYAIDRQAIVDRLWQGRGVVPNDAYPNVGMIGYDRGKPRFEYDPHRARELLAKAGYTGEEVAIEAVGGDLAHAQALTEALATMFQEVGIKAAARRLEPSELLRSLRHKAIAGLWLSELTSPLLDPDDLFWRWLQPGGLLDYWRHPEWDRLMGQARRLHDQEARGAAYKQAATIFLDDVPVLIVLQPETIVALRNDLHWKARGDGVVTVYDIARSR